VECHISGSVSDVNKLPKHLRAETLTDQTINSQNNKT
jgi:hypothetical protein